MILIHHNIEEYPKRNVGMLLPLGLYLHRAVYDAEVGDMVTTADGQEVAIVAKQELSIYSEVANAISLQIYDRPMKYVAAKLHENWGDEMDENIILYLVVRRGNIQNRRKVQE